MHSSSKPPLSVIVVIIETFDDSHIYISVPLYLRIAPIAYLIETQNGSGVVAAFVRTISLLGSWLSTDPTLAVEEVCRWGQVRPVLFDA